MAGMPLDADQLDAFWHVVQAGGFHPAADALHLSQPAVTQRIRALEAALGRRLFVRAGRGVALTDAGHTLVRHCRRVRQAEDELLQALGDGAGGLAGRLAIAAGKAEGVTWVVPALAELAAAHPELAIALELADPMEPAARLEGARADAVVCEVPTRRAGLVATKIAEVAYVLVASPTLAAGWPETPSLEALLARRAIDFGPTDRITLDHLARCYPGADLAGLRRHFVDDNQAILAMAEAGGGFAVLPRVMVGPAVRTGGLRVYWPEVVSRRPLYWCAAEGPAVPAAQAALAALRRKLVND